MKDYYKHDHYHCWTSENPPCGVSGKHRCCLCEEPIPSPAWQKELMQEFTHREDEKKPQLHPDSMWNVKLVLFIDRLLSHRDAELIREIEGMKSEVPEDTTSNYWEPALIRNAVLASVIETIKKRSK